MADDLGPALTTADVMRLLNIGKAALYGLVLRKEIESFRVGREYRFNADSVEAFRRNLTTAELHQRRRRNEKPDWLKNVKQIIK